jgi:hypothetical protein
MSSLKILTDQDLLEAYMKANKYKLETQFIETLLEEIKRRGLEVAAG